MSCLHFPRRHRRVLLLLALVLLAYSRCTSTAFSPVKSHAREINVSRLYSKKDTSEVDSSSSRRDLLWKIPAAGVGVLAYSYSNLLVDLVNPILEYPQPHERRTASIIATAFASAAQSTVRDDGVFRVLEVGIGKDCRLFRRRLYDEGLSSLQEANRKIDRVDITGIDLRPPGDEALAKARQAVAAWNAGQPRPLQVDVQVAKRSVTSPLDYEDGYFDCVICCLTLCSVDDLELAVKEMYRLIRPNGGTFGYLEHVAVNPDEPYRWLELQQKALDPLQQLLVENCHLHRYTEQTIEQAFAEPGATQVFHERFLVDTMWPVTCQCCGVYQRTG